jgi:hypothetical protein
MAAVGTSNISLSGLKASYVAGGQTDAAQNSKLRDGKTTSSIGLSYFRGAGFTDGASVPTGSSAISINSHFKGKTFGSSGGGGC